MFEIRRRPDNDVIPDNKIVGQWRDVDDARFLGSPLPAVEEIGPSLEGNEILEKEIVRVFGAWQPIELLKILAAAPADAAEQLACLRLMNRGHLVPILRQLLDNRRQMILVGQVSPTDLASDVRYLRGLAAGALERVAALRPELLEGTLRHLIGVPPVEEHVRWLLGLLTRSFQMEQLREARSHLVEFLDNQGLSRPWWLECLNVEIPEHSGVPTAILPQETGSTETESQLAAQIAAVSRLEQFRQRALTLRSQSLNALKESLANRIASTADRLHKLFALVLDLTDDAQLAEVRAITGDVVADVSAFNSDLPHPNELGGIRADVDRLEEIWKTLPVAPALSWLDRVQTWDHLVQVVNAACDSRLATLPEWFFKDSQNLREAHDRPR